jgi:hypothetical protein
MSGHGWVTPNPDGTRARCGGPAICAECAREQGTGPARIGARVVAAAAALLPLGLSLVLHGDSFIVTDKPDDLSETAFVYKSIEQVEEFIADHRRTGAPRPVEQRKPRVGDDVHYVSHGSPVLADGTQVHTSACRAAKVTKAWSADMVSLFVMNPTGTFHDSSVRYDSGTFAGPAREALPGAPLPLITCDDLTFEGGTWHWISA